ncbi:hypothetical protein FXO37_29799 [Capsicum annuum]|nr:hypothetical protein FXO37_29799 [Capsicum annuum]
MWRSSEQEKLCSMLKDVLKARPNIDVVKLQKPGGVVSRNAKEYLYGQSNGLSPHSNVVNFSNLSIYLIGGVPQSPQSALSIGIDEANWHPSKVDTDQKEDLELLQLKDALTQSSVLALPDAKKLFVVKTVASGYGFGALLMQERHLIAFISKALSPKHVALSVYDRELLSIIQAITSCHAQYVPRVFLDNVVKLHGLPNAITSERDVVFLSFFWNELLSLQGVLLLTSTAYHPQSDGQIKVLRKYLETYLRCYCSINASNWSACLPIAEYWYNTYFHSAIQTNPYEVLYDRPPHQHLPYLPDELASTNVDTILLNRELMLQLLKHHLLRAQVRMKQQADS